MIQFLESPIKPWPDLILEEVFSIEVKIGVMLAYLTHHSR